MKGFLDLMGVLCIVQAVGGALNSLLGSGSRSWFVVNYIGFLDGYEVFASIVIGVLGIVMCAAARTVGKRG